MALIGDQLLAMGAMVLLLGVPGWAIGRLTSTQLAVPQVALPAVWFAFGLAAWTATFCVALSFGWSSEASLRLHAAVSLGLATAAWLTDGRRGHARPGWGRVEAWTVAGIAISVLLAAAWRTRIAFDTLYHVGLVRRLAELPDPTFLGVDRVASSGVNPAYVVPTWQGAMAAVATMTGVDAATVVEAMAAIAVFVAACAAAGLGRVIAGRATGEIAGVAAYAWMRVWFPRRELEGDGIAYAAIPGNLALDVFLPLVLLSAVLVVRRAHGDVGRPRTLHAIASVSTVLLVLLHANYVVYLAAIGLGAVAWLAAARTRELAPWGRVRGAAASIAAPGFIALLVLLPALTALDHFGAPLEQRIDYHLLGSGSWELIRPGHFYDWFAAPGLLAVLALPLAVHRLRGIRQAVVGGGALALLAIGLVPPLLTLVGQTGSLTLGLRLPRPFGVLLVAAVAVVLPMFVDLLRAVVDRVRDDHGARTARLALLTPFVVVAALVVVYGYPLARREPAEYGWNWPTLVATAGLLAALVLAVRARRIPEQLDPTLTDEPDVSAPAPTKVPKTVTSVGRGPRRDTTLVGLAVVALAICMLPSGLMSLRRGAWQGRQFVASYEADDLGCAAGIQHELRRIDPGAVVLADPVTAYDVQALAPGFVVGDYKTWNGSTDTARANARVELLRDLFDADDDHDAAHALDVLRQRFHPRYLVTSRGEVEPPLGSTIGTFDAAGLRESLASGTAPAELVASGPGRLKDEATDDERAACDLSLWELNPIQSEAVDG